METTGGLSKAAFNFCKEIKKRYESLNCYVDSECPSNYEINVLQSAINVELQRGNSRMVLPQRYHKSVKTGLNDENSVQPTDWRSSTKVTGNNCGRK